VEKKVITTGEADLVRKAEAARHDAIQVDAFTLEEYKRDAVVPDGAGGDGSTRIVPEVRGEAQSAENGADEAEPKTAKAKK
jgi:acyl-CoA dehydrogenase